MTMRSRLQRRTRDHSRRFVSIDGVSYKRGQRLEFRAVHPKFGVLLSGWFIADSSNPLMRAVWGGDALPTVKP